MKTGNFERAAAILEENAFVGTLSYKLYEIFKNSIETKKMICENPKCKSSNIRVEEGCVKCLDCQWNKCGG